MDHTDDDSLFDFPTQFPIKVMGKTSPNFRALVVELISPLAEFDSLNDVREQASSNARFVSVTVTFTATSREQLDKIYQTLNDHDEILMII